MHELGDVAPVEMERGTLGLLVGLQRDHSSIARAEVTMATVRPIEALLLCPAGFEDVVAEAARTELSAFVIQDRSSGLVRARTSASVDALRAFAPATNAFVVAATARRAKPEQEYRRFIESLRTAHRPAGLPRRGSIRLRIHSDGTFSSTSGQGAVALERALSAWTGLPISRRGGSVEVWVIRRRELNTVFLGTRIPRPKHRPARGQLRAEICAALARLEPLSGLDLVLDPFAGTGAIGEACVSAGAASIWLNDHSRNARRFNARRVRWTHEDFRNLAVTPGAVGAIVTDPPWGEFTAVEEGLVQLYTDFGEAARRWLRPQGGLVLLTGAPDVAITSLVEHGGLRVELDFGVLVNGHKARVLRARTPPQKGRRGP